MSLQQKPQSFSTDRLSKEANHPIIDLIARQVMQIVRACKGRHGVMGPMSSMEKLVHQWLSDAEKQCKNNHWNQQIGKNWFPTEANLSSYPCVYRNLWDSKQHKDVYICIDRLMKTLVLIIDHNQLVKIGKGYMAGPSGHRETWKHFPISQKQEASLWHGHCRIGFT